MNSGRLTLRRDRKYRRGRFYYGQDLGVGLAHGGGEICPTEPSAQAGIKTAGRNSNNLRYADDTTLMAESKEELKSLLMKVKEESGSWLKTQHSEN